VNAGAARRLPPLRLVRFSHRGPPWTPIYERPQDYDLEHEGDEKDIRFYERLVKRLARGARSSWRRAAAASRFGWRGSPAGSVGPQRRARHLAAVPQVVGG